MIELKPPFRAATTDDATPLVELVDMASEGLAFYLWAQMAGPGESAWDVGRQRAAREDGSFSYRNATVLEQTGRVVSGLIGYALADEPEPIDYDAMPAMFVPLQELENLAPRTWYVNVLATYPDVRGQGHGARLLALADEIARDAALDGASLIVSDGNPGARKLYERSGYRAVADRPMVKEDWVNPGENWVLMVKRF